MPFYEDEIVKLGTTVGHLLSSFFFITPPISFTSAHEE
jgi:hypothetical protein